MWLTRRQLLRRIHQQRLQRAIEEAERITSGEIRVSVATFFWGDVHRTAERAFDRLGMRNTRERNGVLLFVVPARRRFTVLGDEGIHAKVGQQFWEALTGAMSAKFAAGEFTEGLVAGIEEAGRQLAQHFPSRGAADVNELPNTLDFGEKHPKT